MVARFDERLDGASGGQGEVELFHVAHRVELVEVEPVCAQPLQRAPQFRGGVRLLPLGGLAAEEDPVPHFRHPGLQPDLRLAVGGGHIDVVDPAVEGDLDGLVGDPLGGLSDGGCAEDNDRAGDRLGPRLCGLTGRDDEAHC